MMLTRFGVLVPLLVLTLIGVTAVPAAAQVVTVDPQPMPFPVLAGASFTVDRHADLKDPMYRLTSGALLLRSTEAGWVDMDAYLTVPDRHWGPVSVINCALEVSGSPPHTGLALPARIPLDNMSPGTTITLRFLAQAPLIVLDLEGNPFAVIDTFVEEYHWTLAGDNNQPPVVSAQ